jgi:hypothetical protein
MSTHVATSGPRPLPFYPTAEDPRTRRSGIRVTVFHEQIGSEDAHRDHEQGWLGCLDGLDRYATSW